MRKFLLIPTLLFSCWTFGQSDLSSRATSCDLKLLFSSKGSETPLQRQTKWVLEHKGYVVHPETSPQSGLSPETNLEAQPESFAFFAHLQTGLRGLSGNSDCVSEDFGDLGKRWSCDYKFTLFTLSPSGVPVPFFEIQKSIRQSQELEAFYDFVQSRLAQVPPCLELSPQ